MNDYLVFIRSNLILHYGTPQQKASLTRYWDRATKTWVEDPAKAKGYKTKASASAAVTRLTAKGPIITPTGEALNSWGWILRGHI